MRDYDDATVLGTFNVNVCKWFQPEPSLKSASVNLLLLMSVNYNNHLLYALLFKYYIY